VTEARSALSGRAAELRLAFDSAFADAARREARATQNLLAFRLGTETYALRLADIAGLFADRKITRLAGGVTALLGFAGFRGAVVPVYDLHALLGRPKTEAPRWLAIASGAPVALAFEAFEGHLRISSHAIMPRAAEERSRRLVQDVASWEGVSRPIVHMPSVLEVIGNPSRGANREEET
jgi:purine-binding chemotaxis protein CheW